MKRAVWLAVWILCATCAMPRGQGSSGYVDTRDVEKQIQTLKRRVGGDASPDKQAVAYRWLAELYISIGRLDDAQGAYELILALDPYDLATRNLLAAFLLDRRGDAAAAERFLSETIAWAGSLDDPPVFLGQTYALDARALHALGRDQDAIEAGDRALSLLDADAAEEALRTQARCLESLGRREEAETTFLRLIGLTRDSNPEDVNALIALSAGKGGSVSAAEIDARVEKAVGDARQALADALRFEGAELVVLTGEDRVHLEGTLRRGKENGAVLFVPDLGGRRAVYTPYAQLMALDGVTTLTIDPRGHGDSRCDSLPSFDQLSPYHREKLGADVAAAYQYLRESQRVPRDRIAVVAEGRACAVVEYAIRDQSIDPVVVHLSPVFDPQDLDLASALEFRPPRPVLLVASDEDPYAMRSLHMLTGDFAHTRVVHASGHGVDILQNPKHFAVVSAWTFEALGVSR